MCQYLREYAPCGGDLTHTKKWLNANGYKVRRTLRWLKKHGDTCDCHVCTLNKALEKAGINDFTFHGFRHTFITRKLLEGVSPVIISKVVGTTMKVIMEHYAHIKKEDLKQVLSSNSSGDNFRRNFGFSDSAPASTGKN